MKWSKVRGRSGGSLLFPILALCWAATAQAAFCAQGGKADERCQALDPQQRNNCAG